jgi:hypothetical protein
MMVPLEGEPVNDRCAQPGGSEGLGPAGERSVGRYGHGRFLLAFGEDLEEQFGAAYIQFHVTEFVDLYGYPHRSIYAEPATMPRRSPGGR